MIVPVPLNPSSLFLYRTCSIYSSFLLHTASFSLVTRTRNLPIIVLFWWKFRASSAGHNQIRHFTTNLFVQHARRGAVLACAHTKLKAGYARIPAGKASQPDGQINEKAVHARWQLQRGLAKITGTW